MAQRVQVILEDDFDGGKADETVTFGLDGVDYEIDLSAKNAKALRSALDPYVSVARRTGGRRRRAMTTRAVAAKSGARGSTSEIRAWAVEQGYEVSSRGRVPAEIREAYEKAHK
ncbi:MAG TPA: Lsr2 family protein [Microlunatus sp.]|nr:Lsr2 family protein [Microlunatus sp.]